jgi:hypothetical protein
MSNVRDVRSACLDLLHECTLAIEELRLLAGGGSQTLAHELQAEPLEFLTINLARYPTSRESFVLRAGSGSPAARCKPSAFAMACLRLTLTVAGVAPLDVAAWFPSLNYKGCNWTVCPLLRTWSYSSSR